MFWKPLLIKGEVVGNTRHEHTCQVFLQRRGRYFVNKGLSDPSHNERLDQILTYFQDTIAYVK